jgi:monoamine oxidase
MGSVLKFAAVYDEPWWRSEGLDGSWASDDLLAYGFDCSPPDAARGVLVGFVVSARARELGLEPAAEQKRSILDALERLLGPKARHVIAFSTTDWSAESWSGGGYAGVFPPGVLTQFGPVLSQPVGVVHWAGAESATRWPNFMDGAIRAAERAADEVAAALAG